MGVNGRYVEKSVIIHRDENGFGFRAGGQNPVYVDCVHENGAAWKAGVRKNDKIIKVNGTLVKSYEHQAVVHMIQNSMSFVNLTLHSDDSSSDHDTNNSTLGQQSIGSPNKLMNTDSLDIESKPYSRDDNTKCNNNLYPIKSMRTQHPYPRIHHHTHPISNNLNWLWNIGDDLFQDDRAPPTGVSKLKSSGPSLVTSSSHQQLSFRRRNQNQTITRDNPYYYYKTAPENLNSVNTSSCATSATSLSRSSEKMTNAKHKARNLRARLVEDLKSLAITSSQTNSSSLSSSPSSSDLSDSDDQESTRSDCIGSILFGTPQQADTNDRGTDASVLTPSDTQQPQAKLTPIKTKLTTRRLEIIRELIETEKTHIDKLKQLNDLLYKPIKAEVLVPIEQLKMVFSCHKTLFKIHRQIYKILSATQVNPSSRHQDIFIGKALSEIFEGELARRLENAACEFCACQATNTELLNKFTRKDTKVGEFLAQVANQQMLGRLGIKDLLASCFQRLTKYPLLLDNLLKATHAPSDASTGAKAQHSETDTDSTLKRNNNNPDEVNGAENSCIPTDDEYAFERLCISRALNQSRQILLSVNEAVKKAIAHNRLREIWRKIDIGFLPKPAPLLPLIDIEKQQVLHEGPLTLRLARRTFDVHVILMTQYLIILTREGQDKYKLRYFTSDPKQASQFSPIFNVDEHLTTRDAATDENGFYLLCKQKDNQQRMFEFASSNPNDRAKWKEKIHLAQMYNYKMVPDDDNTLTRYSELISLQGSGNLHE